MHDPVRLIQEHASAALEALYGVQIPPAELIVQGTAPEYRGDYTLVLFPLLKRKLASPDSLARSLGDFLVGSGSGVEGFEAVKGFLNLWFSDTFWQEVLAATQKDPEAYLHPNVGSGTTVMVEFSSPNTNKPLHLGHLRNNFLGDSLSRILSAVGFRVIKANLVNDRGVHICKSMLAWQKFGQGDEPGPARKGDHLVGDYYVRFEQELKHQVATLLESHPDLTPEEARKQAPLQAEVQEMLRQWEAADPAVRGLWSRMNGWVYAGFEATYRRMGIGFDQMYYESNTYLLGKDIVEEGLQKGVFYRKPDGSVWIDLGPEGLDEKLVLRADGTSVYITQDLGTADLKFRDHGMQRSIYVVGNEQDYHFQVLFAILRRLERPYAEGLYHLSYGMVELPTGKMKSREGTVVDADDLMDEVVRSAATETQTRGKVEGLSDRQLETLYETLGLGALKFYLLRVQPRKKMLFDPEESVSLQGDTGPFVQYSFARIHSLLQKADSQGIRPSADSPPQLEPEERQLLRRLQRYPSQLQDCAHHYDPSLLTTYLLDLAKDYNRFYYALPVLKESDLPVQNFRLRLSILTAQVLEEGMALLGIAVPERM